MGLIILPTASKRASILASVGVSHPEQGLIITMIRQAGSYPVENKDLFWTAFSPEKGEIIVNCSQ